ncbi:MAG: hypothetical protein QNJ98_02215 [Planctomycetota bacterium]|nr:hypothetical protein [Planctomycetota bacterium]
MNRRRVVAAGLCLLALAAVAWLVIEGDLFGEAGLQDDERIVDDAGPDADMVVEASAEKTEQAPALEGREAPMPDPSAGRGSVEVLVVGPGNVPLPGVVLEAGDTIAAALVNLDDVTSGLDDSALPAPPPKPEEGVALPATPSATTDANGKAFFSDLPYDGTVTVRTRGTNDGIGASTMKKWMNARFVLVRKSAGARNALQALVAGNEASVVVEGPDVRLVIAHGMPLRLVEQSASTGSTLALAPWTVSPHVGQTQKPELRPLPVIAARATPGAQHRLRVHVSERTGYVPEPKLDMNAWISPLARELIAFVPQRPEAEVMLTLPDGVPMRSGKDWSVKYKVDGRSRGKASAHRDGFGRVTIRGVPFLPGQQVWLGGRVKDYGHLSAVGRFGSDARDPIVLEAVWKPAVPARVAAARAAKDAAKLDAMRLELEKKVAQIRINIAETQAGALRLEAVTGSQGRLRLVDGNGAVQELLIGRETPHDETQGKVKLLVRRPDGTPAAGAWAQVGVKGATLSDRGTALVDRLHPGSYAVRVMGAGATFADKVVVVAGETTTLELNAPVGGEVDVEVVDEEGRGLPFAKVYLKQESTLAHADVTGDVQRIDPYTDHLGRRTLHGVERGEVEVTAVYGARKASVKVQVRDKESTLARIVLAVPKPAPKSKTPVNRLKATEEVMKRLQESLDKAEQAKARMRALEEARKRGGR